MWLILTFVQFITLVALAIWIYFLDLQVDSIEDEIAQFEPHGQDTERALDRLAEVISRRHEAAEVKQRFLRSAERALSE